jgi:hypothetical protein
MGVENAASHTKVLRAGFERTKPMNNLDVYGNKSTYNISSSTSPSIASNVSQHLGNASYKPIYEVPDTPGSKPVYSISGYNKR